MDASPMNGGGCSDNSTACKDVSIKASASGTATNDTKKLYKSPNNYDLSPNNNFQQKINDNNRRNQQNVATANDKQQTPVTNRRELPSCVWYEACRKFLEDPSKWDNSQKKFLESSDSGDMLDESKKASFSNKLKLYKEGKLPNTPDSRQQKASTQNSNNDVNTTSKSSNVVAAASTAATSSRASLKVAHNDGTADHDDGKVKKSGKKRARTEHPASFWYAACKQFSDNPSKWNNSQSEFLRSDDSGPELDPSNRMSFSKKLKLYKEGKLETGESKRMRPPKFQDVEQCLLAFVDVREKYSQDKCGMSWLFLRQLALRFGKALGYKEDQFRASDGWLARVLERGNRQGICDAKNDNVHAYMLLVKNYCKRKGLGPELEEQCDALDRAIQRKEGKLQHTEPATATMNDNNNNNNIGNNDINNNIINNHAFPRQPPTFDSLQQYFRFDFGR